MNGLLQTAAAYHRHTSYRRHHLSPHSLDWAHAPRLDKAYPALECVPLPETQSLMGPDYTRLVADARTPTAGGSSPLDVDALAAAFRLTHTVTARSMHGGQPFFFRSVASAGALYPVEMYIAVHAVDGLAAGVYHYDPLEGCLQRLRAGSTPVIPPHSPFVSATVYLTGIFFRSAWKYRSRAYRYVLLDAGHLLENLRLALAALQIPSSIHLDFDDDQAALLLGLDPNREVCLICVHLTTAAEPVAGHPAALAALPRPIRQASTVSENVVDYDAILEIHQAGVHRSRTRSAGECRGIDPVCGEVSAWQPLPALPSGRGADFEQVLRRRRSRRNFIPGTLVQEDLWTLLIALADASGAGLPGPQASALVPGCLIGPGQALPPGFYILDAHRRQLGMVADGDFMTAMAAASLDQMWLKNAAVHLLFMSDPTVLGHNWGARGYRYAMIEAGRLGQQAYLAATAMGIGACGIGAIYDREAAGILDLTDDGALFYLVGVGPLKTGGAA